MDCLHSYTPPLQGSLIAVFFNGSFSLLAVLHLAYLGLMFGVDSDAGASRSEVRMHVT